MGWSFFNSSGELLILDGGSPTAINNATANELLTVGATTTELDAEANLTFDGSLLSLASSNSGDLNTFIVENTSDTSSAGARIRIKVAGSSSTGDPYIDFTEAGGGQDWSMGIDVSASTFKISKNAALGTNDVLVIDEIGAITTPLQPAVLATNSAVDSNVTGDGATATVDYDTEVFDQNADFASDTFTAPVTGRYAVMAGAGFEGRTTAHTDSSVSIVASNRTIRVDTAQAAIANPSGSHISSLIDMDAGDTLTITLRNQGESSDVHDIRNYGEGTTFSIYLVA